MKINDREIYDPVHEIDCILRQIKNTVIVGIIIISMLLIFLYFFVPKPNDYLTMQSPVRVEMANGYIMDAMLIGIIQYAIDEEWKIAIADEERKD